MALSIIRFDMRAAGLDPKGAQRLYAAALEMGEWADARGSTCWCCPSTTARPDGYLPSPLVMAGGDGGPHHHIPLWVSALLLPLHDPMRLAEDIAVLDLISGGRLRRYRAGLPPGRVRPARQEWTRRGKLLDEPSTCSSRRGR